MKTEVELRQKLNELLRVDSRFDPPGMAPGYFSFCKVSACKTLLWALGENDDDRWHITAKPGPPILVKGVN